MMIVALGGTDKFNKNRSCIEIIVIGGTEENDKDLIRTEVVLKLKTNHLVLLRLSHLIRTEVVLKFNIINPFYDTFKFNKNRSCIEIGMIYYGCKVDKHLFNKNRSCIEICPCWTCRLKFSYLIRTEVVLKFFLDNCLLRVSIYLIRTEVVLKSDQVKFGISESEHLIRTEVVLK